jgi:hypothetical protein
MRERNGTADRVREIADQMPGWWKLKDLREVYDAAFPGVNGSLSGKHCTGGVITHLLTNGVIEKRRCDEGYPSKRGEARYFEYRFKRRRKPQPLKLSALQLAWREFRKTLIPNPA